MAKVQDRSTEYRWDDLRVLLALMRERTLGGAASRLGVDATTVGRRLTALEEALGTKLFDRTRDGVLPLAAAEVLFPMAEEAERNAAAVMASANTFERSPEGVVRLTTPPVVAESMVVPLLGELRARHPALRVELDASTSLADLSRREADLALRVRRPEGSDLVTTKLLEAPHGAFASEELAARLGVVESLAEVPWIGWTAELAGIPTGRWAREHVPEERAFVLRAGSLTVHVAGARQGLGVALLPDVIGALHGLVPLRARGEARQALQALPTEVVWLVGHRALRGVPRVAAVWELLVERAPAMAREVLQKRRTR